MNSRQDEDDRVQRLLRLLDLETDPESSDHVDDDTLALLTGGTASAEKSEIAGVWGGETCRPGRDGPDRSRSVTPGAGRV